MAVAEVHVRSWQLAYRGLLPDASVGELLARYLEPPCGNGDSAGD
jgi:hypothetical protein